MRKKLDEKHRIAILEFTDLINSKEFYLAGGTAVYYYLNHRESEDLDFFTSQKFDFKKILEIIHGSPVYYFTSDTIHCEVKGTKISFFYYPYKQLKAPVDFELIKLASLDDIMCMKILSLIQRGSKKDFVDLFFILRELKIGHKQVVEKFKKKYGNYNELVIYKALTYFDDAETEPELRMKKRIEWVSIKKYFIENFGRF